MPCKCPSFKPHRPGCKEAPAAREAAEKVRAAIQATRPPAQPLTMVPEGAPVAPNQILHLLQEYLKDLDVLVAVYRTRDGAWLTDWSDATPGDLLEAALALRLDAETAWADTSTGGVEDEDPDE